MLLIDKIFMNNPLVLWKHPLKSCMIWRRGRQIPLGLLLLPAIKLYWWMLISRTWKWCSAEQNRYRQKEMCGYAALLFPDVGFSFLEEFCICVYSHSVLNKYCTSEEIQQNIDCLAATGKLSKPKMRLYQVTLGKVEIFWPYISELWQQCATELAWCWDSSVLPSLDPTSQSCWKHREEQLLVPAGEWRVCDFIHPPPPWVMVMQGRLNLRSKKVKCSDAVLLGCCVVVVVFLSSKYHFPPSSLIFSSYYLLLISYFDLFRVCVHVSWWSPFPLTTAGRGCGALAGSGNPRARFLSHCFPLSQCDRGVFLPGVHCVRICACTARLDRTQRPDKQNTLSAYEFCTLAGLRHFSKLCYWRLSLMCKTECEPCAATDESLGDNAIRALDEYPCNAVNIQITLTFRR